MEEYRAAQPLWFIMEVIRVYRITVGIVSVTFTT